MSWTDKKIEDLKKLWEKGLTTAEIGKRLSVSKNAVVGKAHRLGLQGRPSPIKKGEEEATTPTTSSKRTAPVAASTVPNLFSSPASTAKKETGINIVDLNLDMCRWPDGDPRSDEFYFCGKPVVPSKPYCLNHCMMAYTATKGRDEPEVVNHNTSALDELS